MFETQFRNADLWKEQAPATSPAPSRLSATDVERVLHLRWAEHCVECAVPECYTQCPLYVKRSDGQCSRFVYGIMPNKNFSGHYGFGADVRFRRWGKIQADFDLTSRAMSPSYENFYHRLPGRVQIQLAKMATTPSPVDFDEFVLECFSPERETFHLVLEHIADAKSRKLLFRHSFEVKPGANFFSVPYGGFGPLEGHLLLYPEGDRERRLIFTWLDFVKFHGTKAATRALEEPKPAAQVKCIAWDLDNTLWQGILAETNDPTTLKPFPAVLQMIRDLDERGIIQTIVSKNTHSEAWKVIERLGLQDYFIYPAINWGPKSQNLKQVAERINIGIDTFAMIDDSAFERAEVSSSLPQVRVFAETEIDTLLSRPELGVPVTEASRVRRHSYLANMKRDELEAAFTGSYEEFLLSCGMTMKVFEPRTESELVRCWELIQRSNQLNISNRRYEYAEFKQLLAERQAIGVAFDCRDKFGEYGLVGFAILKPPAITDFVMSCRVAQKRVEHAFFSWLAERTKAAGFNEFRSRFIVSPKNKPMREALEQLPFRKTVETDTHIDFVMNLNEERRKETIVKLEFGPLPKEFGSDLDGLKEGAIREERDLGGSLA